MEFPKDIGLRVLVVEDDEDILNGLKILLELQGNIVLEARGVGEAKKIIESHDFDILICDTGLPDGSGLDVPKMIGAEREVHKIAASGYGSRWDQAASYAAGFQWYLQKPYDPAQLTQLLLCVAAIKRSKKTK